MLISQNAFGYNMYVSFVFAWWDEFIYMSWGHETCGRNNNLVPLFVIQNIVHYKKQNLLQKHMNARAIFIYKTCLGFSTLELELRAQTCNFQEFDTWIRQASIQSSNILRAQPIPKFIIVWTSVRVTMLEVSYQGQNYTTQRRAHEKWNNAWKLIGLELTITRAQQLAFLSNPMKHTLNFDQERVEIDQELVILVPHGMHGDATWEL